ncbi:MAG TPA: radical SAM protein [Smithella sp.]|nr:radical SAM protein [Smithella sp.]
MLLPVSNSRRDLLSGSSPDAIAIELTSRCNLHCKMCRFWKRGDKDFPCEKVLSLLDEAYELGARRFDPWGTELFMRDDMPEILEYADRIGFRNINIVSNGLLLNRPELLDRLAKIRSLVITVSLDGPEAVHDELRGPGVFKQAVSSLRELGHRNLARGIASIIMRPTINHLDKIIDLAADLKIETLSLQPFNRNFLEPGCDETLFDFSPREEKMISKKLKYLLKYAKQKRVIIYTGSMMKHVASYLARGVNPIPPRGCRVPLKTLVVDIAGNTHPCFAVLRNMGNVNEMNLSSIWHGDVHRKAAVSAIERKCPGCLMACSDVDGYDFGIMNNFRRMTDRTAGRLSRHIERRFQTLRDFFVHAGK